MALYGLLSVNPMAYFMLGVVYFGAGTGRALSIALNRLPLRKALIFLALEWPLAAWLIWAHWPM